MALEEKKTFAEYFDLAQRGELEEELLEAKIPPRKPTCATCGNKVDKVFQNHQCKHCLDRVFARLRSDIIDPVRNSIGVLHI